VDKKDRAKQADKEKLKAEQAMQLKYRNVFCSPEGRDVFKHMLEQMGFFDPITCVEEQALHNYAKTLIYSVMGTANENAIDAMLLGVFQHAVRK
jgi:hypothetical protein